jgi:hypothetical protein
MSETQSHNEAKSITVSEKYPGAKRLQINPLAPWGEGPGERQSGEELIA